MTAPTTKRCSRCGSVKPTSDFHRNQAAKDGLQRHCKACNAENNRQWRARHIEHVRLRSQRYHAANRERSTERMRRWRAANPDRHFDRYLRGRYGITLDTYQSILALQGGRCGLCSTAPDDKPLHVDHDHRCCPGQRSCGACVRGLLCGGCNRALGRFRDDPNIVLRAHAYLVTPPASLVGGRA